MNFRSLVYSFCILFSFSAVGHSKSYPLHQIPVGTKVFFNFQFELTPNSTTTYFAGTDRFCYLTHSVSPETRVIYPRSEFTVSATQMRMDENSVISKLEGNKGWQEYLVYYFIGIKSNSGNLAWLSCRGRSYHSSLRHYNDQPFETTNSLSSWVNFKFANPIEF